MITGSKDVGTLEGLREVSEDIVDEEDSLGGIGRTSDIWRGRMLAVNLADLIELDGV